MKNKKHIYRKLFTSTFYLSAFTFGGGYVIIPLMKKKYVDDLQWIEEEEMLNLTAIAQSSPEQLQSMQRYCWGIVLLEYQVPW